MFQTVITFALGISVFCFAGVRIDGVGEPVKTVTANNISVKVFKEAKLQFDDKQYSLYLSGAAIRVKTVFFVENRLYVASSYTDLADGVPFDTSMDALKRAKVRVMQLVMTDNLSARLARNSFEERLKANQVALTAPGIKTVLDSIKDDLTPNTVINIIGFKDEGSDKETVYADWGHGPILAEGENLSSNFWTVWFGKVSQGDEEFKKFKLGLTTKP